jgi:hypothetical protein
VLTVLLAFILLGTIIAAMSIGVLMGRKPITGSCGGIGAALGEKNYSCDICGGDPNKCDEQQAQIIDGSDLAIDASKAVSKKTMK